MRGQPRERPIDFRPDYAAMRRAGIVFAGLGGQRCAGSMRFADSSGLGNHGLLTNMNPTTDWVWVPELGRWANDYREVGYINIGDLRTLNFAGDMTVACWATVTVATSLMCIVGKTQFAGDASSEYHIATQNGKFFFAVRDGSSAGRIDSDAAYSLNRWYHLAIRRRDGTVKAFVDGGAQSVTRTVAGLTGGKNIARIAASSYSRYQFGGRIADSFYCSRALTDAEIAALADPSNVMLSLGRGSPPLLLPPKRRLHVASVADASGFKPWYSRKQSQVIGGGVV